MEDLGSCRHGLGKHNWALRVNTLNQFTGYQLTFTPDLLPLSLQSSQALATPQPTPN